MMPAIFAFAVVVVDVHLGFRPCCGTMAAVALAVAARAVRHQPSSPTRHHGGFAAWSPLQKLQSWSASRHLKAVKPRSRMWHSKVKKIERKNWVNWVNWVVPSYLIPSVFSTHIECIAISSLLNRPGKDDFLRQPVRKTGKKNTLKGEAKWSSRYIEIYRDSPVSVHLSVHLSKENLRLWPILPSICLAEGHVPEVLLSLEKLKLNWHILTVNWRSYHLETLRHRPCSDSILQDEQKKQYVIGVAIFFVSKKYLNDTDIYRLEFDASQGS